MNKQRRYILIASAIGVVSMFLPWMSVLFISINGMHGIGVLIFFCFVACGILAFAGDQTKTMDKTKWTLTLVIGGLAFLIMVIKFFQSLDYLRFIELGFFIALLASAGILGAAYFYRPAGYNVKDGIASLKDSFSGKQGPGVKE